LHETGTALKEGEGEKKATKMRELNKKTRNKLSQEAAKARTQETKQLESSIHQDIMKKVNHNLKKPSSDSNQAKPAALKRKEKNCEQL
jgi:hypothetical protein